MLEQTAEKALRKALSLNGNLLTALWQLSLHYVDIGESEEAIGFIKRMFGVTRKNPMAHFALGYLFRYTGMLEESVREVEAALALDPRNPRFRSAGFTYLYNGDYRKAYQVFELAGESTLSIAWRGMALCLMDDKAGAIDHFDRAIALEPKSYLGLRHAGVRAYLLGKTEEGLQAIRELEEANPTDSDSEHWYLIGNAYGLLGDRTGCVRALRRAIAGGFFNYPAMLKDPLLDPVRDDPEFNQVLALAKEKHERFKRSFSFNPDES
jgi:tetratricopeptide (TPR) repeat protein